MSSETFPPPGRSGLILGDILGRSAGEAKIELLALFFGPRTVICGVFRPFAPFIDSICGLWLSTDVLGRMREGEGMPTVKGDIPIELNVGVVCPSVFVSIRDTCGRIFAALVAGSGSANPSIASSMSMLFKFKVGGVPWGDCISLINEAGVAGDSKAKRWFVGASLTA